MTDTSHLFLKLLRASFCDESALDALRHDGTDWQNVDWNAFLDAIAENAMESVAFDGLLRLCKDGDFHTSLELEKNEGLRYEWMGLQLTTDKDYASYVMALKALVQHLSKKGFDKVMVLKGYGLSLNYSVPSHRTMGDIDIFSIDGRSAEIDEVLSGFKSFNPATDSERHSHAVFRGFSVENHHHLTNASSGRRYDDLAERVLVGDALSHPVRVKLDDVGFYVPSPTFNAIFLIWHMAQHFILENVTLRQLCDWMTLLKNHSSEIDWKLVTEVWADDRKTRFAAVVNGALIEYMGMDPSLVPPFERNREDEDRFIECVMEGKPLKTGGVEAVLKYWRRRWNLRVSQDESWLVHLCKAVISKL